MNHNRAFEIIYESLVGLQRQKAKPIRVAINGIEGTGKTTFSKGLVSYLQSKSVTAINVSIDGFHFNKEHRYRQGRDSVIGYYEDSYDEVGFVDKVLLSSQKEPAYYISATHDLESDLYVDLEPVKIPNNAVLVTDGAYLFKQPYRDHWDLKIYLKTNYETALKRGAKRDRENLGGMEGAIQKFNDRYHKASKLYIKKNSPETIADLVIDNTDFENLKIIKKNL